MYSESENQYSTARHSLSESSAEQNIRNFSVLGAFRQADLNAER